MRKAMGIGHGIAVETVAYARGSLEGLSYWGM